MIVEKLKQIKESEAEIEKKISQAEQKAKSIFEDARRKSTDYISQAIKEARAKAEKVAMNMEKETEQNISSIKKRAGQHIEALQTEAREKYDKAVSHIVERITRIDGG